jgi:hypothetical protein
MRFSAISVTGSTAVVSLAVPLVGVAMVSVSLVAEAVDWLVGCADVTPHNISPAKTGKEKANISAIAARKSLRCFMVSPEKELSLFVELITKRENKNQVRAHYRHSKHKITKNLRYFPQV